MKPVDPAESTSTVTPSLDHNRRAALTYAQP
jgi:hypothetical protein